MRDSELLKSRASQELSTGREYRQTLAGANRTSYVFGMSMASDALMITSDEYFEFNASRIRSSYPNPT
jgi:hypothetical protein